jgi:endonuclease/exonuclease/phosphatase family metal-dependent hydrolase
MTVLRVASYNIRKCVGLDRRRDPDRVLGVIAALGADAWRCRRPTGAWATARDARAARIEAVTGLPPSRSRSTGSVSAGTGTRCSCIPTSEVEAVRRLELPGLEPRGAVMVEACAPDARSGWSPSISASRAPIGAGSSTSSCGPRGPPPDLPTVILGDFNEWRKDRGLEPLARASRSMRQASASMPRGRSRRSTGSRSTGR